MVNTESISTKIVDYVHENSDSPSSKAVLKYGITIILNYLIFALLVLAISAITGDFKKGMLAIVALPVLRYFSGGMHLKSAEVCNVVSASLVLLAVYIPIDYWNVGLILTGISVIILFFTAPSNVKRSSIDPKYYPVIKAVAMCITASNFLFHSPLLSIAFFMQSLTTCRIFQRILDKYRL